MSTLHFLPPARRPGREDRVVALHCSGSSGRQWHEYAALLPPGTTLHAPDLLGYGADEVWRPGERLTLDAEAQRLLPLLEADGGVHLLGHSYGGAVALQMALRWPDRVRTLTLYEPVRFGLLLGSREQRSVGNLIVGVAERICALAEEGRTHDAARLFVEYWSGGGAWEALAPRRQEAIACRMHKVSAEFMCLLADREPAASFARLDMPVRLLMGGRSPLPARRVVEVLARQRAGSYVVHLPSLGHMGPISHPGKIAAHFAFATSLPLARAA